MAFGKNRFAKHSGETKKFGNKKITNIYGTFDSKREWNRYSELAMLEKQGVIGNLERQVKFELVPKVKFTDEQRAKPAIRYFADFTYNEKRDGKWRFVVEDAKGFRDDKYRMKKHMMLAFHGIEIQEV